MGVGAGAGVVSVFVGLWSKLRVLLSGKIPVESMCPLGPIFSQVTNVGGFARVVDQNTRHTKHSRYG